MTNKLVDDVYETFPVILETLCHHNIKSYRCPKFDGDAKQTLEIRVQRKRNLKLRELGEVNFIIFQLGELGEVSFRKCKLGDLGK